MYIHFHGRIYKRVAKFLQEIVFKLVLTLYGNYRALIDILLPF